MPRKPSLTRLAPVVGAGLLLLAIPTAWAVADTTSSTTTAAGERIMRLNWTITEIREGDVAPTGLSTGDTFQAAFQLTGRIRGTADYSCVHVETRAICDGIIRLADGDIYVSTGPIDDAQPAAILGGTRAYLGVRGQFTKTANPDGTGTYTLVYRK